MKRLVYIAPLLFISCFPQPERVYEEPVVIEPTEIEGVEHRLEVIVPQEPEELPKSVLIKVPFAPQAPHANWDDPYQEACEEASVIMVHAFLNQYDLSLDKADEEILKMVKWQTDNGYGEDVSIEQLSTIVKEYYGLNSKVYYGVSTESIMREVAKGNPVILPAAGRELGNPYFSGEGPWYHMLVVVGYDQKYFITNDPGTRRGEGYKYKHNVLLNAVHNWTGVKEETSDGPKVMMVIEK